MFYLILKYFFPKFPRIFFIFYAFVVNQEPAEQNFQIRCMSRTQNTKKNFF